MSLTIMTPAYAVVDNSDSFRASMIQVINDVNKSRHSSAIGIVVLLYDNILTLSDAIDFIKYTPPSLEKKVFLLNRYFVLLPQICTAVFMDHFSGKDFDDLSCQIVFTITFTVGIFSMAISNVLVMLRVISLWECDHLVIKVLAYGFVVSFLATLGFAIEVLYRSMPGIKYLSYAHSCASTTNAKFWPGVWAPSLAFEAIVLTLVVYNALSRPRGTSTPLRRVLYRDGILFFAALSGLRFSSLMISIYYRPTVIMCAIYVNWALMAVILNRSLLNIHKARSEAGHLRLSSNRRKDGSWDADRYVEEYPLPDLGNRRHSGRGE